MARSASSRDGRCCTGMCCSRCCLGFSIIIGVILCLLGVFVVVCHQNIFTTGLSKLMPLSRDSLNYDMFVSPPAIIYMTFHFFNLTNPEAVVAGEKPILKEIGPYVYRNKRIKENVTFSEDGTQASFIERRFFEFDSELSSGSEDDTFYQLDVVVYGIAKKAYEMGASMFLARTIVIAKRKNPFKQHIVKEFLFGAPDLLMEKLLPMRYPDPANRPAAVFGLFVDRETGASKNGSIHGNFTIYTGKDDISKIFQVVTYNGVSRFNEVWKSNITDPTTGKIIDPNVIRGSLGAFGPGVTKDSILTGFGGDMCLSLTLSYSGPSQQAGVDTLRFTLDRENWRNYTSQLNSGLCSDEDRGDPIKCLQRGVLDVSSCKEGAPMAVSMPHLLYADEFYQNLTEGLSPDPEKHAIFLDIDPLTGGPLKAAKRMQMNVALTRFKFMNFKKLPEFTLLPLLWMQESASMPEQLISKVYSAYDLLPMIGYALIFAGVIIAVIGIAVFVMCKQKHDRSTETVAVFVPSTRQGQGQVEEKRPLRM